MMEESEVKLVCQRLNSLAGDGYSYEFPIMEIIGPKGAALRQIVNFLNSRGLTPSFWSKLAVRFYVKNNINPQSRSNCPSHECPVHGWLVYSPASDESEVTFRSSADYAALQANIIAFNLSAEFVETLRLAEMFPSDLARLQDEWINQAGVMFPHKDPLDIIAAAGTITFEISLSGFASLILTGCKGSSCPGRPIVRPT